MDNTIRVFSGRAIGPEDIELVKWARKTYPKLSRYELAGTVCELLNWNTPAGRAKYEPCIDFLETLEAEGVVQLPALDPVRQNKSKMRIPVRQFDTTDISGEVSEFEPIRLTIAQRGQDLNRWRAYVNQYHMLGDKTVFGSRLQYFVKSGDIELGCIQFSASSWALEERDRWIGWKVDDRKVRLNLIVNNSRYLIFPWVIGSGKANPGGLAERILLCTGIAGDIC